MPVKLGIIATHPIQYQVPWYRALVASEEVNLKVYFGLLPDAQQQGVGFGKAFEWDVPLLEGYEWECLPSACKVPGLDKFCANRLKPFSAKLRADGIEQMVITGWHAWPMLQALGTCVRLGIPCIVRGESNAMRSRPLKARLLHRLLLPRYQAYLAIGESSAAFYEGYGVPSERVFFSRYFIDNERFAVQAARERPRRSDCRQRWGIPKEAVCFVFVGKLEPKKRLFDVLAALENYPKDGPAVHLLVVGSGEQEEEAQARVIAKQLPVSFAGFLNQSEISQAYVAADALVLPSDFGETWGLVVNEAMVSGLPVVISDRVGCGPDLVYGKGTGHTFAFGDSRALAAVLHQMACDPAGRVAMAQNAQEVVAAYNAQAAAEGTLEAVRYLRGHKER